MILFRHEGKMLDRGLTEQEVRRYGNEYGSDLAAALVLASSRANADRSMRRQMAQVMLDHIGAVARELKIAAFPADLIQIYERGVHEGVRDELLKSCSSAAQLYRAA
jgi:hypothetical protein